MSTIDHEIGHTLVAASLPDGTPGYIDCNPGEDANGPHNGICNAHASSAYGQALVWIGGVAGNKVFAGENQNLPEDSGDYIGWQEKSREAGIDPEEAYNQACALLDTEANYAAHKALKDGLKANNNYLDEAQVREIIGRTYKQFPDQIPVVGAGANRSSQPRTRKKGLGTRINAWLSEFDGQMFKDGKWRFWLPTEVGIQVLIGLTTIFLFPIDSAFLVIIASAIILWLLICFLHYTDTSNQKLNKGLSRFDSVAIIFAVAHFCFLLWVFGHYSIIRHREIAYEGERKAWNKEIDRDQERELKQTELEIKREQARALALKREADANYWAAQTGQRMRARPQPQTLNQPGEQKSQQKQAPKEWTGQSSDQYLESRDWIIRLLHMIEFLMAIGRLIYVRLKSVEANYAHNARVRPADPARSLKN